VVGKLRESGAYWLNGQTHGQNHARSQPIKFGPQWHVVGTYPDGQQEHITGFKTEADALDWIANDSATWLEKRRVR